MFKGCRSRIKMQRVGFVGEGFCALGSPCGLWFDSLETAWGGYHDRRELLVAIVDAVGLPLHQPSWRTFVDEPSVQRDLLFVFG